MRPFLKLKSKIFLQNVITSLCKMLAKFCANKSYKERVNPDAGKPTLYILYYFKEKWKTKFFFFYGLMNTEGWNILFAFINYYYDQLLEGSHSQK